MQVNVVDFLKKVCGFDFTEEEIFRAIGILRTNALHVQDDVMKKFGVGGRAVYPTFSFLSHSCISNARYRSVLNLDCFGSLSTHANFLA